METPQNDEAALIGASEKHSENPAESLLDKDDRLNFGKNKCNDMWAAILFYAQIAAIIVVASAHFGDIDFKGSDGNSNFEYIVIFLLTIVTGLFGAYVYLNVLRNNAKTAINTAIIVSAVLAWVYFIYMCTISLWVYAVLWGIVAVGMTFYYFWIQNRIPFTVALIEIGITIIDENQSLLVAVVAAILGQALFVGIWAIAFLGYAESTVVDNPDDPDADKNWNLNGGTIFAFVLSGFWTFEVIRYVLYTTAAGVTASWFFTPDKPNATSGAFKRAAWFSFGSIAFGGLLIAIIKTLEVIVRYAQSNNGDDNIAAQILVCCVLCILSCLEDILEFLNEFGFAFVAIYGMTYCEACKSVWTLLKSTKFESIFQYDLTGVAIFLGCLITGLLTFVSVYLFAEFGASGKTKDNALTIGVVTLFVSLGICWVALMIIVAAVTTTFIVWALDPRTIAVNRQPEFDSLVKATEDLPDVSLDSRHLNPTDV